MQPIILLNHIKKENAVPVTLKAFLFNVVISICLIPILGTISVAKGSTIVFNTYVPSTPHYSSLHSGPANPTYVAIQSAVEWHSFWSQLNPPWPTPETPMVGRLERQEETERNIQPAPPIDFQRFTLVVAAIGRQFISGHRVSFVSFQKTNRIVKVRVVEYVPGRECTVTTTATSPIALALIPKTDKPFTFDLSTVPVDCVTHDPNRSDSRR
jgi:hypothetical protein